MQLFCVCIFLKIMCVCRSTNPKAVETANCPANEGSLIATNQTTYETTYGSAFTLSKFTTFRATYETANIATIASTYHATYTPALSSADFPALSPA